MRTSILHGMNHNIPGNVSGGESQDHESRHDPNRKEKQHQGRRRKGRQHQRKNQHRRRQYQQQHKTPYPKTLGHALTILHHQNLYHLRISEPSLATLSDQKTLFLLLT
ncbi:hypothetical protein SLA2020_468850 [Shorea laevis]